LYDFEDKPNANGGYGSIFVGVKRATEEEVVLKTVNIHSCAFRRFRLLSSPNVEEMRKYVAREWNFLATLSHPHIVSAKDENLYRLQSPCRCGGDHTPLASSTEPGQLEDETHGAQDDVYVMVMERMTRDLYDEMHYWRAYRPSPTRLKLTSFSQLIYSRLPPRLARSIVYQIATAIDYLHQTPILHRDLSWGNVMLRRDTATGGVIAKIIDLGLSRDLPKTFSGLSVENVGTVAFCAPELHQAELRNCGYGTRVDVWSLGIVLFLLLTGNSDPNERGLRFRNVIDALENDHDECVAHREQVLSGLGGERGGGNDDQAPVTCLFCEELLNMRFVEGGGADAMRVKRESLSLLEGMLKVTADERFSIKQVLGHSWLAEERAQDPNPVDTEEETLLFRIPRARRRPHHQLNNSLNAPTKQGQNERQHHQHQQGNNLNAPTPMDEDDDDHNVGAAEVDASLPPLEVYVRRWEYPYMRDPTASILSSSYRNGTHLVKLGDVTTFGGILSRVGVPDGERMLRYMGPIPKEDVVVDLAACIPRRVRGVYFKRAFLALLDQPNDRRSVYHIYKGLRGDVLDMTGSRSLIVPLLGFDVRLEAGSIFQAVLGDAARKRWVWQQWLSFACHLAQNTALESLSLSSWKQSTFHLIKEACAAEGKNQLLAELADVAACEARFREQGRRLEAMCLQGLVCLNPSLIPTGKRRVLERGLEELCRRLAAFTFTLVDESQGREEEPSEAAQRRREKGERQVQAQEQAVCDLVGSLGRMVLGLLGHEEGGEAAVVAVAAEDAEEMYLALLFCLSNQEKVLLDIAEKAQGGKGAVEGGSGSLINRVDVSNSLDSLALVLGKLRQPSRGGGEGVG